MHPSAKLLASAGLLVTASGPVTSWAQAPEAGGTEDCLMASPGAVSTSNNPVSLRLRMVLDGVPLDRATAIMNDAQQAYTALSITVVPSYQFASFIQRDSQALLDEVKQRFNGQRPGDADAVYVMTDKDLVTGNNDTSVAGQADCIGGVAFPRRAFAVGEALADSPTGIGPVALQKMNAAKVLSHELGHLLGAHHHYANCGEAAGASSSAPCTLMFNDVSLQALKFSTLNASVVRGTAQQHLPTTTSASSSSSGGSSSGVGGGSSGSSGNASGGSSTSGGGGGSGSWMWLVPALALAWQRQRRRLSRA